jgi:peptidyl-prolyl cis-trans isomerase A (cyclophilin A)
MLLLAALATGCAGKKTLDGDPELRSPEPLTPDPAKLDTPVPDKFRVKFETGKGDFVVEVTKDWAPLGAAQFYRAVDAGFYDGNRFFRVAPDFVVQWGINGDPEVQKKWRRRRIEDEPVKMSNKRGTITFAKSQQPDSRTTQLFINLADNTSKLDHQGFPAFGKVVSGMEVVDSINAEYGERPNQGIIEKEGNEYLNATYPRLDYIKKATILKEGETGKAPAGKKKSTAEKEKKADAKEKNSADKSDKKPPNKKMD